jgi:pilus assembly protein CpaE
LSLGELNSDNRWLAVVTVGLDHDVAQRVKEAILHEQGTFLGEVADYRQAMTELRSAERGHVAEALVCVLDFDKNRELAVQGASALQQGVRGRIALIAVSADAQPDLILNAMRAGCSEYLTKPLSVTQFCESLVRLRARWSSGDNRAGKPLGRIIGLLGVRGGVGTTTLAVHLGTFLAKRYRKKALIIDHHPYLGHLALFLGVDTPRYHFYELLENIARLDGNLFDSYVVHHSSGVDFLSSPGVLNGKVNVQIGAIEHALRFTAELYDFVIIDLAQGLDDDNLAAITSCDELYLVATPEVPALRDLSRYMDRLLGFQLPLDKLKVVINRYSSDRSVSLEQIQKAIHQPISVTIPSNGVEIIRAIDTGAPVAADRKSEFASQMRKWAEMFVPSESAMPETKRRFTFWN